MLLRVGSNYINNFEKSNTVALQNMQRLDRYLSPITSVTHFRVYGLTIGFA